MTERKGGVTNEDFMEVLKVQKEVGNKYKTHGKPFPEESKTAVDNSDAILFGAIHETAVQVIALENTLAGVLDVVNNWKTLPADAVPSSYRKDGK
ncbi:MAG: hypothetical protein ACTSPS_02260 [Promethearchaeota archaeon]